jgi:guanylate kinase
VKGQLFTVSAPSGAGKTSLVRQLVQRVKALQVSVSHTTRAMRPGEVEGRDYHFVKKAEFESMVKVDAFLEHAAVFEHYYGTSKASVEKTLNEGIDVLLEIDWQGASQIKRQLPQTCSIFILPPSKQALLERLQSRGQDSDEVIERRTAEAVAEMKHYDASDFLIINDKFDEAVHELVTLVECKRLTLARQRVNFQDLINSLLQN